MSGPNEHKRVPLPQRLVVHYRGVVAAHANDSVTRACPICGVARCSDWRFALAQLVCAGEPMEVPGTNTVDDKPAGRE
jgi:hypothetical protein